MLVALALAPLGCSRPSQNPDYEKEVLALINAHRTAGATCGEIGHFEPTPPLVMNEKLRRSARVHARWMGENQVSHRSSGGPIGEMPDERMERAGYRNWRALGENVAAGQTSPQQVVDDWMVSVEHCANIMNPSFREVGVGYAYLSGTYWTYWTQDFGASLQEGGQ